ncbi:MAG: hypothetical protein JSW40_01710 [Candidatus Omnitrophota bacterium]|nr:MAG: hypothetical protein JSW40_01710 [Candidatus Omnitrophota bacterium]
MKKLFKKITNILFKCIGLKLCRLDTYKQLINNKASEYYRPQHIRLIKEVEGCFCELIFPELLPCDGRAELMAKLLGTGVSEAMYILAFLHKSLKLEGDVCEFGVAQGATSALLANEIRTSEKNLWLFDSFKGLPKPDKKDLLINDIFNLGSMERYEGMMSCPVDEVKSRLQDISFPFSKVKIIPGFIEESINYKNLPAKICFAYLDLDFYKPTLIVLRFLDKHLSNDGFIVVDDYGWFSSGVKTAVDEFIEEYPDNYEIIWPYKFASYFCILHKKHK